MGKSRRVGNVFNRCVKSVRKTVKARKGSTKESAAIAICTKSVLQTRGRTMKRYRKGRLVTQKKLRGGVDPIVAKGNTFINYLADEIDQGHGREVTADITDPEMAPIIDGIITRLQTQRNEKSTVTKIGQAIRRMTPGFPHIAQTPALIKMLTELKNTGKSETPYMENVPNYVLGNKLRTVLQ